MAKALGNDIGRLRHVTGQALSRVEVLALFPFLTLVALVLDLGDVVVVTAFLLPGLLALHALLSAVAADRPAGIAGEADRASRPSGPAAIDDMLRRAAALPDHDTACILLQIDGWTGLIDRWGRDVGDDITMRCMDRLLSSLRRGDCVKCVGDGRFAVVLHPIKSARLGIRDAIVTRLRASLAEPLALQGGTVRLTTSAGHATLIRTGVDIVADTIAAAETALSEAHRNGPDASRAFTPALLHLRRSRIALSAEVEGALAAGEIRPWFQPQVSIRAGTVTGMEALARWHHPDRGVIPPADFLEAVDGAGRMSAMGQVILRRSLAALLDWDKAGIHVPTVSVNVSAQELRDPAFADRVKWELDRFDLRPDRLTIEILETVAAQGADDVLMTTLSALGSLGVRLDLDDFGIGQASLVSIRRFGVRRIKIDRSFIERLDTRPEQKRMVAAILSMAHHLGVETLAEGVETDHVRGILDELGCDHAQGFLIARPMPFDRTVNWIRQQAPSAAVHAPLGQRAG